MLDPRLLRTQLDEVARRLASRGFTLDTQTIEALERERKDIQTQVQQLQQSRNELAKKIGQAKAKGEDAAALMAQAAKLPEALKQREAELEGIQQRLEALLLGTPNLPHESVPDGCDENANVEVRRWGEPARFDFTPK